MREEEEEDLRIQQIVLLLEVVVGQQVVNVTKNPET